MAKKDKTHRMAREKKENEMRYMNIMIVEGPPQCAVIACCASP